jgi:hypothetical protein
MPKQTPDLSALQNINIGTNANDGTGDNLRSAFEKVNGNFELLYGVAGLNNGFLFSRLYDTPQGNLVAKTVITVNDEGTGLLYSNINSTDFDVTVTNDGINLSLASTLSNAHAFYGDTQFNGNVNILSDGSKQFYVQAAEVNIATKHINIASDATTNNDADDAGICIPQPNAKFIYKSVADAWVSNKDLLPAAIGTYNLGSEDYNWDTGHIVNLNVKTLKTKNLAVDLLTANNVVVNKNLQSQTLNVDLSANIGNLVVVDDTSLNNLDVAVNVEIGRNLHVSRNATIDRDLYVLGNINVAGNTVVKDTYINVEVFSTENRVVVSNTDIATSTTTGALQVTGGVGVAGDVYASGFFGPLFGNVTGQVSSLGNHNTDDVAEGNVALYFTEQRARNSLSAGTGLTYTASAGEFKIANSGVIAGTYGSASKIPVITVNAQGQLTAVSNVSVAGVSNFTYNSTTANLTIGTADGNSFTAKINLLPFTTTDLAEGTNLYYTSARANSDFDTRLALKSTTNLAEGTNLYYTDTRARNAISVAGSGGYDPVTGVITVTGGVTSVNTKTGAVTLTTTDVSEGTNLYYTDTRFDNRFATKTTTNLDEGTNLYYTSARANSDFDTRLALKSTTNLAEGTNLYFTDARAKGAAKAVIWNEFASGAVSPKPGDFTAQTISGFNAYTSTDFPGAYYTGITVSGNTIGAQLAIGWNIDNGPGANVAPNSFYIRSNDDTGDTANWSPWKKVLLDGDLPAPVTPTTTDVAEGTNLYYTSARANSDFDTRLATKSTSNLTEGTNLYFTNARARSVVSFTAGSGAYDSSTGIFTIPTNTNQLTNGAGFITGYTETDTLSSVVGRGATTTASITTGGLTSNGLITPTAGSGSDKGIRWPNDPGGGGSDSAWIRYYARTGENTTLEIGTSNDAEDIIKLVAPNKVIVDTNLEVTGNIVATGDITAFSDERIKTNIRPIKNALAVVNRLEGVMYEKLDTGETSSGMVAQRSQPHTPELVKTNQDGMLSVAYGNYAGYFVEAIKELTAQVEELRAEVARLKGQ